MVSDILRLEFRIVSHPGTRDLTHNLFILYYSVFDYTYLLFWNSFWTIAPVLGIGLFDRIVGRCHVRINSAEFTDCFIDADVLMAFPELYRYGRERTWFTMKSFVVYMIDGIVQVCYMFASAIGINPWYLVSSGVLHHHVCLLNNNNAE